MRKKIVFILLVLSFFLTFEKVLAFNVIASNIIGDLGNTYDAQVADIDGDGDVDIYVVNYNQQNKLWINDGSANFTASDIVGDIGSNDTGATLHDIDGDGDIDIYVTSYGQNRLWINDGLGNGGASFSASNIVGDNSQDITGIFFDANNDGFLDLYVTELNNLTSKLWINDGLGNGGASFTTTSNIAGDTLRSYEAVVADIDNDGDMDIHVPNGPFSPGTQNNLWINDGLGNGGASFSASNIVGDTGASVESIVGDIDNDGDLDIYVSNWSNEQNNLWINDGLGNGGASFSASNIVGDTFDSAGARMVDIDNDGDLDIYVGNYGQNKLWINDGSANFTADDISGDLGSTEEVLIADFNNDGKLDFYTANYGEQNNLWLNDLPDPPSSSSSSSSSSGIGSIRYVCKDKNALNYNPSRFARHSDRKCDYSEKEIIFDTDKCPHFTQYYKIGDIGGEIPKIQKFLIDQGYNIGNIDGIMGAKTLSAIHFFQTKYFSEVLQPWSLTHSTGRWYQSTRKKANELVGCPEGTVILDNGVTLH